MGEVCLVPPDVACCLGQRQVLLRPKPDVDPRYLHIALQSPFVRHQILWSEGTGSTVSNIRIPVLEAIRIPRMGRAESHIAAIIGALDDKIELNRRMNETLEASARALFRDWFVDFGPTRAKAEGRPAYLAPDLWSLFPDRLGDDGLPEGWPLVAVRDHLELKYGKSLPARDRTAGAFPVYGSGGQSGTHCEAIVRGPAVIVGRKGTVGSLFWEDRDCYPIDTAFYVAPKLSLAFCYELLAAFPLRDMNTDAAVPGLNRENVYRLELANPPTELIVAFDGLAREIRARMSCNDAESRTLAETRDALLPKLMSGAIRVREQAARAEALL